MAQLNRVPTGILGLDEVLFGGFLPGRTYLLVGAPGTGKTILAFQWLREGAKQGERNLYITLAESISEILKNLASFGWDLRGIDVVDLSPEFVGEKEGFYEYRVFHPSEVEETLFWDRIWQAVVEHNPQRLVLDPVTILKDLSPDLFQFRRNLLRLVARLNARGITTLLTAEPEEVKEEVILRLVVDGVIRLTRTVGPSRLVELRAVEVEKFRGADYLPGLHPLRITARGIEVFPHRIFPLAGLPAVREKLSTGIAGLDQILDGGLEVGTATLITGPAGVGKTTLGLHILATAAQQGMKAVHFSFEEHPPLVIARAEGVGIPLRQLVDSGKLVILAISPLTLYPDEFLQIVRHHVEKEGRKLVMIDSLRGYNVAMEEFGSLACHIHNLAAYLGNAGVTSLWLTETEKITGELSLTELGVSFIFDNAILIRNEEQWGQILRAIGCLKKRGGRASPEVREFKITSHGLWVGEELLRIPGFFSGIAPSEVRERP